MDKIAVMFPGQASQYVGMGKSLYEGHELVRQRFSEASQVLGFNLADMCFNGPAAKLTQTENAQPAILALSVAMFEAAQKEGLEPSFLAGHSLGELSALTAAGVFTFSDAVKLAHIRGKAMAACTTDIKTGMMAVIKIKADSIEPVILELQAEGHGVQIANYNAKEQTVLSGSMEGLKLAEGRLSAMGAKIIQLNVSGPFHSHFMAGAVETIAAALAPLVLGDMLIPVINGLEGRYYTKDDDIKKALLDQVTGPVRWTRGIDRLAKEGVALWVEMGPKNVLKKLLLENLPQARAYAYGEEADRKDLKAELEAIIRDRKQRPNLLGLCLGAAVSTRNTNWDEAAYQRGVIEPYREIQRLFELVEKENRLPEEGEMRKSLTLLREIFNTKGTPADEQNKRFSYILRTTEAEGLFPEYMISAEGGH